jgi:pentatricopeptide repeat protein
MLPHHHCVFRRLLSSARRRCCARHGVFSTQLRLLSHVAHGTASRTSQLSVHASNSTSIPSLSMTCARLTASKPLYHLNLGYFPARFMSSFASHTSRMSDTLGSFQPSSTSSSTSGSTSSSSSPPASNLPVTSKPQSFVSNSSTPSKSTSPSHPSAHPAYRDGFHGQRRVPLLQSRNPRMFGYMRELQNLARSSMYEQLHTRFQALLAQYSEQLVPEIFSVALAALSRAHDSRYADTIHGAIAFMDGAGIRKYTGVFHALMRLATTQGTAFRDIPNVFNELRSYQNYVDHHTFVMMMKCYNNARPYGFQYVLQTFQIAMDAGALTREVFGTFVLCMSRQSADTLEVLRPLVNGIFEHLCRNEIILNSDLMSHFTDIYGKLADIERLKQLTALARLLEDDNQRDMRMSKLACKFASLGEVDQALDIVTHIIPARRWSYFLFNCIMNAYGKLGRTGEVIRLHARMVFYKIPVRASTYHIVIQSFLDAGNVKEAQTWYSLMIAKLKLPSTMLCNRMIRVQLERGKAQTAFSLFSYMKTFEPPSISASAPFHGSRESHRAKHSKGKEATTSVGDAQQTDADASDTNVTDEEEMHPPPNRPFHPNSTTYVLFVRHMIRQAEQKAMKKHTAENNTHSKDVEVQRHQLPFETKEVASIERFVTMMIDDGIQPNGAMYGILLHVYKLHNMQDKYDALFERVLERDSPRIYQQIESELREYGDEMPPALVSALATLDDERKAAHTIMVQHMQVILSDLAAVATGEHLDLTGEENRFDRRSTLD